jgi:hypothetical protein
MARYAYLDHFQLRLDNRAQALIDFVEETSHPDESSACDKRSPVAAHWSLASMRRALGLQNESALGIVFARAEALLPEFAEFVVQSAIFKEYSF